MGWYLKTAFQDDKFRLAAFFAAISLAVIVSAFVTGVPWMLKLAYFVLFPLLALCVLGMFIVFGMIVYDDYSSRKVILKRPDEKSSRP